MQVIVEQRLASGLIWPLCGHLSKITVLAFSVREKLKLSNEKRGKRIKENNKIDMSA
jgi:hypothetical protein